MLALASGLVVTFGDQLWVGRRSARVAAELGLEVLWGAGLMGDYRGHAVQLWSSHQMGRSVARITLEELLLPGMLVMSDVGDGRQLTDLGPLPSQTRKTFLGGQVVVWGPAAPMTVLLEHPLVVEVLQDLLAKDIWFTWVNDKISVHQKGNYLDDSAERLHHVVRLFEAFETVWRAPWLAVARERGLRVEGDPERPSLAGLVDGVPVVVRLQRDEHGALLLRAVAQLRAPLPDGLRIQHQNRGTLRDVQLGDMILDQLLFIQAPETANLAQRLNQDAVRGPLLEALHGHPGSVLTSDRIGVLVRDRVLDPDYALELVLAVEGALNEFTPPDPPS